ncbi:hypothetical protein [Hyphomicrobium sp.]|uniref:hypothetical protein n=1 Tax=Hyphomicrobium sp. TaxID=82 RepID=UPI003566EF60
MKAFVFALSALAVVGLVPVAAQAADLDGYNGGYIDRGPVVEGPPVSRRYYDDYDAPAVAYYAPRFYRPYPYYAGYYPYRHGYWGRPYWRGRYWGGRPYGGYRGHWGGHRGWR